MTVAEYNKCVDSYSDNVFRFILKNIKNEDDAHDIVQNSFEILWRKYPEVSYEKAKSYLFTVAYNNMIDQIRKNKRMVYVDDHKSDTRTISTTYTGANEIINVALNKLPEDQRSVVLLRDYEGYSYQEIAEITDLSEAQVKVYIFRARKALQKYLISIDKVI